MAPVTVNITRPLGLAGVVFCAHKGAAPAAKAATTAPRKMRLLMLCVPKPCW